MSAPVNPIPQRPTNGLAIKEVPEYVESKTGTPVALKTVYNWINKGVGGEKLKIVFGRSGKKAGKLTGDRYTTHEWIDSFLLRAMK